MKRELPTDGRITKEIFTLQSSVMQSLQSRQKGICKPKSLHSNREYAGRKGSHFLTSDSKPFAKSIVEIDIK
jgi:hypothetical protein